MARMLYSRFNVKACPRCGKPINQGAAIYYDRSQARGRRAWHADCEVSTPQPVARADAPVVQPVATVQGKVLRAHSNSVRDFCTTPVDKSNLAVWERYVGGSHSHGWLYGDAGSLKVLDERLRDGWSDGAERIAGIDIPNLPKPQSIRRARRRADFGAEVDVTEYWRGRGDVAWSTCKRAARPQITNVRIVPMIAGSCGQSSDQFFWRGAAVARLADALTDAGYNVEIIAAAVAETIGNGRKPPNYCHTFTIKDATAPLDTGLLAAVLCQQGFVRHYMFRSFAALRGSVLGSHMGMYGDKDLLDKLAATAHVDATGVLTVFMKYDCDSPEACRRWIIENLKMITGDVTLGEAMAA